MIRDITIGQYYPAKSVLHRLDPRTKFLGTLGFLISVFLFHTFLGYAVATAFLVAMIAISKVPVKFMFKGLKAIVMILLKARAKVNIGRSAGFHTGQSQFHVFYRILDPNG